eukprot:5376314-Pyramimonas_sp.AAC.2
MVTRSPPAMDPSVGASPDTSSRTASGAVSELITSTHWSAPAARWRTTSTRSSRGIASTWQAREALVRVPGTTMQASGSERSPAATRSPSPGVGISMGSSGMVACARRRRRCCRLRRRETGADRRLSAHQAQGGGVRYQPIYNKTKLPKVEKLYQK